MESVSETAESLRSAAAALEKLEHLDDATNVKISIEALGPKLDALNETLKVAVSHIEKANFKAETTNQSIRDEGKKAALCAAHQRRLTVMNTHAQIFYALESKSLSVTTLSVLEDMAALYGYRNPTEKVSGQHKVPIQHHDRVDTVKRALTALTMGKMYEGCSYLQLPVS